MEIAIISDTHLPHGARQLPQACVARLRGADVIIHGGDLTGISILKELKAYGELVAVHGNVDEPEVRAALPATAELELPTSRIAVVHDAGPARGRLERLRRRFPDAGAVVFGHSHMPLLERMPDGFQIFNPGSPTDRRRAPSFTMGIAHVEGEELHFELVTLD